MPKKSFRRWVAEATETPEQREERRRREEARIRRVWESVGLTLEEAEEKQKEFVRTFYK